MELPSLVPESSSDRPGLLPNRACRNCVQIKAKCVPHESQPTTICQRCYRLGKICATPAPVGRKRLRRKSPKHTEPDQMVSNPVELFNGRHEAGNTLLTPPVSNAYSVSPSATLHEHDSDVNGASQEIIPWVKLARIAPANAVSPEICHPFAATSHERYFDLFRTSLIRYFPFIVIPQNVTPTNFSKERPFLYTACVMAGAHQDPPFQARVARDMLKYVSERMIQAGEKSFDLLQGLLIAVAWYHVYSHENPQLMNLVHLAKALMIDLGLNRPPGSGLYQMKMSNDAQSMLHGTDVNNPKHTLEQRRTYLAVYHASSILCACFRRMDDMRWSEHLEDCCRHLETNPQLPSDEYAAALVRLDRLVERYTGIDGIRPSKTMPIQAYIRLFSNDIDRFKNGLSSWLQEDSMMIMHLRNAELCLFELAINPDIDTPAHTVDALYTCLSKVATYIDDTFLMISSEMLCGVTFLIWAHVTHAFDLLAKLSFIRVTGWDLDWVRQNPGFIGVTNKVIAKLNEAFKAEQSQPGNVSIRFKMFAGKLQWCQQWYNSKVEADTRAHRGVVDGTQLSDANLPDFEFLSYTHFGEFSDMLWQDFMNDWPSRTDAELGLSME